MTKLLRQALEAVQKLRPESQDESLRGDEGAPEPIEPALAQARRRQFASDAEVEAAFRRFDQRSRGSRGVPLIYHRAWRLYPRSQS